MSVGFDWEKIANISGDRDAYEKEQKRLAGYRGRNVDSLIDDIPSGYKFNESTAPEWQKKAAKKLREKHNLTEQQAGYIAENYMESNLRQLAETGHARATGLGGVYEPFQDVFDEYKKEVYFPEQKKKGVEVTGDQRAEYLQWEESYKGELKSDLAKQLVTVTNRAEAEKLINDFKTANPDLDISDVMPFDLDTRFPVAETPPTETPTPTPPGDTPVTPPGTIPGTGGVATTPEGGAVGGTPTTPAAPVYKFEMPTEWQSVSDYAQSIIDKGTPELTTESIQKQVDILEPITEASRKDLEQKQRDRWAFLFSRGGGTGVQAGKDLQAFADLEINKLNKAIEYARAEKSEDLTEFLTAQKMIQDIGTFKAQAGQFTSVQEAANYWNTISQRWDEYKTKVAQSQAQQQIGLQEKGLETQKSQFQQQLQSGWAELLKKRTWEETDWDKYANLTRETNQARIDAAGAAAGDDGNFWEDLLKGAVGGIATGWASTLKFGGKKDGK